MLRLFVAIPLDAALQAAVHAEARALRDAVPDIAWTPADRLHLTVKFIGDTAPALVEPLGAALHAVAAAHTDVPLIVRGAGAFPTLRRPRVVWVGVDAAPRLELLQHDVEVAAEGLGIPLEGRAFRPHVTLGRVRAPLAAGAVRALARAARGFHFEHAGHASSLDLMQSTLTEQGPRYRCLATAPLRAR